MLLIPPRSHCVSHGAVSGKQGTGSEAAVTIRGCKRQFWFPCELWDIDWCHQAHPLRDLGAGHHRPGQQDNGATLATLPWQVSTRRLGMTAPLVTKIAPIWWYLWVWVWSRNFRTVFSDIVRIKVKARSWNLLLSYFNITPFWKIKLQSILSTDHFS